MLDVFEDAQEAEVAWIGYKQQERLPVQYINVLIPPNPINLEEGFTCSAVLTTDGMWYPCIIEKILSDDQAKTDLTSDLKSILSKYQVKFKNLPTKVTVPLDYIRLSRE